MHLQHTCTWLAKDTAKYQAACRSFTFNRLSSVVFVFVNLFYLVLWPAHYTKLAAHHLHDTSNVFLLYHVSGVNQTCTSMSYEPEWSCDGRARCWTWVQTECHACSRRAATLRPCAVQWPARGDRTSHRIDRAACTAGETSVGASWLAWWPRTTDCIRLLCARPRPDCLILTQQKQTVFLHNCSHSLSRFPKYSGVVG